MVVLAPQSPTQLHACRRRLDGKALCSPTYSISTRPATFDPRQRHLIGDPSPCKFHVFVKNRCWTLLHVKSTTLRTLHGRVRVSSRSHGDTGLSIFASPNICFVCGPRLSNSPYCLPRVDAVVCWPSHLDSAG